MLFLLIFIMCGVLLRGLYKSMLAWAGKWKRDSLEFLRISGIACFVLGFFLGNRIELVFPGIAFALWAWLGYISIIELQRRGGLDKELREGSPVLRNMDERLRHLGNPTGESRGRRPSRGGVSMDTSSASAEPVSRWPKDHQPTPEQQRALEHTRELALQEAGEAQSDEEISEIVVDMDSGRIDLSDLIEEAAAEARSERQAQGSSAVAEDELPHEAEAAGPPHEAEPETEAEPEHEQAAEPEEAAPDEPAEPTPARPAPSQPEGYNSGPVKLSSNVGSLFSGTDTPLTRRASGPLTSLGGSIPHYELDLRSRKQPKEAARTEE